MHPARARPTHTLGLFARLQRASWVLDVCWCHLARVLQLVTCAMLSRQTGLSVARGGVEVCFRACNSVANASSPWERKAGCVVDRSKMQV